MTNAQTRTSSTRLESVLSAQFALPAILTVNTVALFALDRLGGIPTWIKTAAALFLSF